VEDQGFEPGVVDVVVFDVIGTLVDEDVIWAEIAREIAADADIGSAEALRGRWAQLLEARMQAVVDGKQSWQRHSQFLVDAAVEAVTTSGGRIAPSVAARISSMDSEYPAWPDVADATAAIRRNRVVVGLSNGDLDSLARLANVNGISWDAALSAGTVQTFKPAGAAYRHAIDSLRLVPQRTLFAAAHPWDLRAAASHGFRTAYIGRPKAERPSAADRFDVSVAGVSALADLLA
jgi:2-haloacid dehalogenase